MISASQMAVIIGLAIVVGLGFGAMLGAAVANQKIDRVEGKAYQRGYRQGVEDSTKNIKSCF